MKVASGTSRWALPSGIPRRTPSARASGFASMTGPGSHGRPPRTSGPGGKGSKARARASSRGRCGRWRWRSRIAVGPFVDRGGWIGGVVAEEVVAAEAGVALATLRVEDPEGRPPPRRAVAIACDQRLRPLADDVASEPDPRPPGELEAEAGRLGDGASPGHPRDRAARARRRASPSAGRAPPAGRAGRRCGRACPWRPAGHRAGRGRAGRPSVRPAARHRWPGPRRASRG